MTRPQFDVVVIGGGCAGMTAAVGLARAGAKVLVLEAAPFCGAENWSGCVYFTENIASEEILGREGVDRLPFERRLSTRGAFVLRGGDLLGLSYTDPTAFAECCTVLRPVYDRAIAAVAESLGVVVLNAVTAEGLIRSGGAVVGVATDRGPVYAPVVFLAEGDASHLVTKEGFETVPGGKPHFLQGIKEVLKLDAGEIERRFHLSPGQGAAFEIIVRNGHVGGKTARLNMGGFVYTNRDSLSVGLVLPLDLLASQFSGDHTRLMSWFKTRSGLAPWLSDAKSVAYGAKLIRGGGIKELPRLADHGVAVGGAASGIGIDFPYPNFTGPATATGLLFSRAWRAIRAAGGAFTRENLEKHYVEAVKRTHYYKDLEFLRDWPEYVEHTKVFFENQVDLAAAAAGAWGGDGHDVLESVRRQAMALGLSFPPGRRDKWEPDLRGLEGVFGAGTAAGKAAFRRVARGPGRNGNGANGNGHGVVRFFHRSAEDAHRGGDADGVRERVLSGGVAEALAGAARAVYRHDDRTVPQRITQAVDALVSRFPARVAFRAALAGSASVAALPVVAAWQAVRGGKPDPRDGFVRWVKAGLLDSDLNPTGDGVDERWEQKLSRLSYFAEPAGHIRLHWPGSFTEPGAVVDSPLWHVCPAHVYERRTDATGRSTLVVNFENCIKCESCWRATDAVDWSRNRRQRLIYQLPIESAAELARSLDRLDGPTKDSTPHAVDPWLPAGPDVLSAEQSAKLIPAVVALSAKLRELSDSVEDGARFVDTARRRRFAELPDHAAPAIAAIGSVFADPALVHADTVGGDAAVRRLRALWADAERKLADVRRHLSSRRLFWAAADARQIVDHHLVGLVRGTGLTLPAAAVPAGPPHADDAHDPFAEFDRRRVLELDRGRAPTDAEKAALDKLFFETDRAAIRRGVRMLARHDPALAAAVAAHHAANALLKTADLNTDNVRIAPAFGVAAVVVRTDESTRASVEISFVAAAGAVLFLVRTADEILLIERPAAGVRTEPIVPLGMRSAEPIELHLNDVEPTTAISGETGVKAALEAFDAVLAELTAQAALGAGEYLIGRARDHAAGRVQFPGLFTDEAGNEAILKFGAVKALLSDMEARRFALSAVLDALPERPDPATAAAVRLLATDFFGPRHGGFAYNCGQIFGGTAFSEEDVLAKFYRDSATLHFLPVNERQVVAGLGRAIVAAAGAGSPAIPGPADDSKWLERCRLFPGLAGSASEWDQARALHAAELERRGKAGFDAGAPASEPALGRLARSHWALHAWACALSRASKMEEAAVGAEHEVECALHVGEYCRRTIEAARAELERLAEPVAVAAGEKPAFVPCKPVSYDAVAACGEKYETGDPLIKPDLARPRYVPEMLRHDPRLSEFNRKLEEFFRTNYKLPAYGRMIEKLHRVPADDIARLQQQGFFRLIVPKEQGGAGGHKAEYYAMIAASIRLGDMAQALTIQVNSSIGTTPILMGLFEDLPRAQREIDAFLADVAGRARLHKDMLALGAALADPGRDLVERTKALAGEIIGLLTKSAALRSIAWEFQGAFEAAMTAGKAFDLATAGRHLERAAAAWTGLEAKARDLRAELPRRKSAMELFLRWIAAEHISGFALTEPSAGSDTARVATRAKAVEREVFTDSDGVKFFHLDDAGAQRRVLIDADRIVFDMGGAHTRVWYRAVDGAAPTELKFDAYDYETDRGKRYFTVNGRRIDFDDVGQIRKREGREFYAYWELSGNKMWITNGRMAGVFCLYARSPAGPTGFLVDRHSEGLVVGKDEEKLGQLGSPTNELSLDRVRVPMENIIGLEGRGQVNALQTLNVGRVGLALSCAAMLERVYDELREFAASENLKADPYVVERLHEVERAWFAVESLAYESIGLLEQIGGSKLVFESAVAKFYAGEAVHHVLDVAEEIYGLAGQTRRHEIEKHRRDARVLNIYEGTNEVQRFAVLRELVDHIHPRAGEAGAVTAPADWPPELRASFDKLEAARIDFWKVLREGLSRFGKQAWMNPNFQSTFFPLCEAAGRLKAAEAAIVRAGWISRNTVDPIGEKRARSHAVAVFEQELERIAALRSAYLARLERLKLDCHPADIRIALRVAQKPHAGACPAAADGADVIERPIRVLVPVRIEPHPAPEPHVDGGESISVHCELLDSDRAALVRARRLKSAAPDKVRVLAVAVGPARVREGLRQALAIGADDALWIKSDQYVDQPAAWVAAVAEELRGSADPGARPDVVLCGAADANFAATALLGAAFGARPISPAGGFSLHIDSAAIRFDGRVSDKPVRLLETAAIAVGLSATHDERAFTTADYLAALSRPIREVALPAGGGGFSGRWEHSAVAAAKSEPDAALTPDTAVAVLADKAGLELGGGAAEAAYSGPVADARPQGLAEAVTYLTGTADGEPTADATAGFAVAEAIGRRLGRQAAAVVLTGTDEALQRKWIAALAAVGAARVQILAHEQLVGLPATAVEQALDDLFGTGLGGVHSVASGAVAQAAAGWAVKRPASMQPAVVTGVHHVAVQGDSLEAFVPAGALRRVLRLSNLPRCGLIVGLSAHPAMPHGPAAAAVDVRRHKPPIAYDRATDPLVQALSAALRSSGAERLEDADFIIDVGYGIGNVDNFEELIPPLAELLKSCGVRRVAIGGTRRVTEELKILPGQKQIGQSGSAVNPTVLICVGVSGAPQHVNYIGDRASVLAFNRDAEAPLMTLNRRRPRPKVYPVVGDLFVTVPAFMAALRKMKGQG